MHGLEEYQCVAPRRMARMQHDWFEHAMQVPLVLIIINTPTNSSFRACSGAESSFVEPEFQETTRAADVRADTPETDVEES